MTNVGYYDLRGDKIAYQAYPWDEAMIRPFEPQICVYDLKTGESKVILEKHVKANYRIVFWKDDEILFTGTDLPLDGEGQASDFFALDIKSGEFRKILRQGLSLGCNDVCSDARYGSGNHAKRTEDGWYYLTTWKEGATILHQEAMDRLERVLR